MTRLLTVLLVLTAAASAHAQVNHPYNEVGIYTVDNPDGCSAAQVDAPAGTTFTCYVVLTNPYSDTIGAPITEIGGYDYRLDWSADLYVLEAQPPPGTYNFPGFVPEAVLGTDVPVVAGRCTLMTMRIMPAATGPIFLYLGPVQNAPQTIPGEMAFVGFDDEFVAHVMHPVSGSFDVPVFAINWDGDLSFCETVPDEGVSFGGVKALYR